MIIIVITMNLAIYENVWFNDALEKSSLKKPSALFQAWQWMLCQFDFPHNFENGLE